MKLLVKNGMIATESQVFQGDILIEDEKIKSIGTVLEEEDAEVIDATGRYVIPGGGSSLWRNNDDRGSHGVRPEGMQPVASGGRISSSGRWEISH